MQKRTSYEQHCNSAEESSKSDIRKSPIWLMFWEINDRILEIICLTILALFFTSIASSILVFKILALAAMPMWFTLAATLVHTIAVGLKLYIHCTTVHNGNGISRLYPPITWCTALFCLHSFLLAGYALIPAAATAIMLGFTTEHITRLLGDFFNSVTEELPSIKNFLNYMIAHLAAIIVTICMFVFMPPAITAAIAPHAVAILCAYNMAKQAPEVSSYIKGSDYLHRVNHPEIAIATFLLVSQLHISFFAAPIIVTALFAFNIGLATKEAIIFAPKMKYEAAHFFSSTKGDLLSIMNYSSDSDYNNYGDEHTLDCYSD